MPRSGRIVVVAVFGTLAVVPTVGGVAADGSDALGDAAGGVVLFVARVEDHAAVDGASVTLTGTSRAGVPVSMRGVTDREGRASFDGVPAGRAYRVEIASPGRPARVVSGLAVREAVDTMLLPVFVGPRVLLEGRFVDESGVAVPGAHVRVLDDVLSIRAGGAIADVTEPGDPSEAVDPPVLGEATTDAQGRYRVEGLPAGPVEVRAAAEGKRETIATVFLGPDGPAEGPPTRVLRSGTSVNGTVVDGAGRAVQGALVVVSSARGDSDERRRAVSDAEGRFRVTVADRGPFFVSARRSGDPSRVWQRFESPPTDVRVPLAPATTFSLSVVDRSSGAPIADAAVEVGVRGSMNLLEGDFWTTTSSGTTDAAGRLTRSVPAGFVSSWILTAAGHLGVAIDNEWWLPNGDPDAIPQVFGRRLRAGTPLAVTIRLRSGSGASGAQIAGRVVDPEGAPVQGAHVVGVAIAAVTGKPVLTDAEGRFRLEGPADEIVVRARGFVQRAEDRKVEPTTAGGTSSALTLRLERPRTVRGRVLDAEGRGVAGARVSILPGRSNDASITTRNRGVSGALEETWGRTAADGTYVLYDLVPLISVPLNDRGVGAEGAAPAPGPAHVVVRARGFVDAQSPPFAYATGAVTNGPPLRVSRGARWVGRVLTPEGRPVPDARLDVEVDGDATGLADLPAAGSWRTSSDGSFVVRALPPGSVKICAVAAGFAPTQKTRHVRGEDDLPPLDVVLRPARRVTGSVVDASGAPIRGASVLLDWLAREDKTSAASSPDSHRDEEHTEKQQVRSDENGRFVLEGLPSGVVELEVKAERWRDPRTKQPRSTVRVDVDGPPPAIVLERDPDWVTKKRKAIEEGLKDAREGLASFTDPDIRAAADEEIASLEQQLREIATESGAR